MELLKGQSRFINHKTSGSQLLKGKENVGKSTASIFKAINLENNYCIFNEDRILVVNSSNSDIRYLKKLYNKEKNKNHFYSLFSLDKERLTFTTMEDVILTYSEAYRRKNGLALKAISYEEQINILNNIQEINKYKKKSRFLLNSKTDFLLNEILWIKYCNLTLEEYREIDRKGRARRINKKSYTREAIYKLKDIYSRKLIEKGFIDESDHALFAIESIKKDAGLYTHIIIDNIEKYTKSELDFIRGLFNNKSYSSMIYILNSEMNSENNSWFIKGRKLESLNIKEKIKTFYLKEKANKSLENKVVSTIENYKFISLKNKREIDFNIDTSNNEKEIYLENEIYKEDNLKTIPMYSNIAAGSPIEIFEEKEDEFYLPNEWLERNKDTFILRVKGDSMINKNIRDGDLVIIKRQLTANHNDIIAANLDGEATLKTLSFKDYNNPVLLPANEKYPPIRINDKNFNILGVAIGIIRWKN